MPISAVTGPMMLVWLRHVIFMCLTLIAGWPAMADAAPLDKTPQAIDSPAFLLVASARMSDPRFRKTVLLVTRHGKGGPIGVILNRPESVSLDKMFPDYPAANELSLFNGGPVYPGQVSYLVKGGAPVDKTLVISSDIYLAYDLQNLRELLSGKQRYKALRVLHGMAAWAPGQLEREVKQGDWDIVPVDESLIFDGSPDEMWKELNKRANLYHEI